MDLELLDLVSIHPQQPSVEIELLLPLPPTEHARPHAGGLVISEEIAIEPIGNPGQRPTRNTGMQNGFSMSFR